MRLLQTTHEYIVKLAKRRRKELNISAILVKENGVYGLHRFLTTNYNVLLLLTSKFLIDL